MELGELLRSSTIIGIELHAGLLLVTLTLFVRTNKSFIRNSRRNEMPLALVYSGIGLMIISDCIWSALSSYVNVGSVAAYAINLIYFLNSSLAATSWFTFCTVHLETKFTKNRILFTLAMLPFALMVLVYLSSPWTGAIFSIQNGEYVRGDLFFLDPVLKMGYIAVAILIALLSGLKKEVGYLRNRDFYYAFFGIPVIVCGVIQTMTGVDFNCLGVTVGLALVYANGVTNPDIENTDAIYSLAYSFEASYLVNADTGLIRPLRNDVMHDDAMEGMNSMDYTTHFTKVLSQILLPEDKEATLAAYDIENVAKRFEIDKSFSVRYRAREASGQTALHMATFVRAKGRQGRREFLLGVNTIKSDSLLFERNEALRNENQRLEQINMSIIDSVAKMVEARDGGSGDHIVRVKKLTEIIAREIMVDYPEYKLDEEAVKLISNASVLHDVGKIVIPDAVLLKPGRLTDEEFEIMKTHSTKGCDILNLFPLGLDDAFLECALSICRWHHEKYDGKGYPDGLVGDDIPIAAQIVSLTDCFDALVSDRPYKKAFAPEKAFEMLKGGECGSFSPKIISAMEKQESKLKELARLYR